MTKEEIEEVLKQLIKSKLELQKEIEQLQERIDKAIEYIEKETKSEAFHHYINDEDLTMLLNILKGE